MNDACNKQHHSNQRSAVCENKILTARGLRHETFCERSATSLGSRKYREGSILVAVWQSKHLGLNEHSKSCLAKVRVLKALFVIYLQNTGK